MFACLLLPQFRLAAALRWRDCTGPAAVVDCVAKGLILEVNEAALAKNIHPGFSPAQAMARDMRVHILTRSPAQEDALHHMLVDRALSLSPDVEETAPGMCLADLRKRPKPPSWHGLADEIVARFSAEKLRVTVAFAPTPDLAILAAKGTAPVAVVYDASAFAGALPVSALELSASAMETLRDWGIATVGQLLALPCADVIERLGSEAARVLQKVSGRSKRPLRLIHPAVKYAEAFDFEHEVESTEPLLFLLRRFLISLTDRLQSAHRVARQLQLGMPLDDGTQYERTFTIPAPTSDLEVRYRILDTHLSTLRLEQRPIGLQLEIEAGEQTGSQLGLFETALRDLNGFGETLARLKAFLGEDSVGIPRKIDSYRPDTFALDPMFPVDGSVIREDPACGIPLRRYRPAILIQVETKAGIPVSVRSNPLQGTVVEAVGPFRLSGDWWDNQAWRTEEWDVELDSGAMLRLSRSGTEWKVEGAYELC